MVAKKPAPKPQAPGRRPGTSWATVRSSGLGDFVTKLRDELDACRAELDACRAELHRLRARKAPEVKSRGKGATVGNRKKRKRRPQEPMGQLTGGQKTFTETVNWWAQKLGAGTPTPAKSASSNGSSGFKMVSHVLPPNQGRSGNSKRSSSNSSNRSGSNNSKRSSSNNSSSSNNNSSRSRSLTSQ